MNPVLLQAATRPGLDPWQLILDATPVVKVVLMVLVLMALVCWYIIGAKLVRLRKVRAQSQRFLRSFWTEEQTGHWDEATMNDLSVQASACSGSPDTLP